MTAQEKVALAVLGGVCLLFVCILLVNFAFTGNYWLR